MEITKSTHLRKNSLNSLASYEERWAGQMLNPLLFDIENEKLCIDKLRFYQDQVTHIRQEMKSKDRIIETQKQTIRNLMQVLERPKATPSFEFHSSNEINPLRESKSLNCLDSVRCLMKEINLLKSDVHQQFNHANRFAEVGKTSKLKNKTAKRIDSAESSVRNIKHMAENVEQCCKKKKPISSEYTPLKGINRYTGQVGPCCFNPYCEKTRDDSAIRTNQTNLWHSNILKKQRPGTGINVYKK